MADPLRRSFRWTKRQSWRNGNGPKDPEDRNEGPDLELNYDPPGPQYVDVHMKTINVFYETESPEKKSTMVCRTALMDADQDHALLNSSNIAEEVIFT